MRLSVTIARLVTRVLGSVMIILGLLFWSGNALALIPVHMLVGILFVLTLWTLAVLAARAGVQPGWVALGLVWGLVVPILGLTQDQLLPGPAHVIIKILHLLVGLGAIGLAETLARRSLAILPRQHQQQSAPQPAPGA